jgi:hypothetical protein
MHAGRCDHEPGNTMLDVDAIGEMGADVRLPDDEPQMTPARPGASRPRFGQWAVFGK